MVSKFAYGQQYVSNICKYFWKAVLYIYSLSTIGCEQHFKLFWKAVSSHLFLWPTGSEWHCTFCERKSHHIFSYTNREWVTLHISRKAVSSSHCFLWTTDSEWHCLFYEKQPHHIYDQQDVSDIAHLVQVSSHLFLWPTGCEWHCTFCERQYTHFLMTNRKWVTFCGMQFNQIISYDQQRVSDIAQFVKGSFITYQQPVSVIAHSVEGSHTTSFPMTSGNYLSVILHILWKAVSWHLFLWQTASEWHCTFCEKAVSWHLFLWPTASWVMLHILWKAVSWHLSSTDCEWHSTFCERQSHDIFSCDQQTVSDIPHFVKTVSWHLFLSQTDCEWHCTFCERNSHDICSYGQQIVRDIAHLVKGSLFTSFPITNRESVTLHMLCKEVSSHLLLWPAVCEWHCKWWKEVSSHFSYDQQHGVSDIAHFVKQSHHIISCDQ